MVMKKFGTIRGLQSIVSSKVSPYEEAIHQSLAVVPIAFNELLMGFGFGWAAPTLYKLSNPNSEIPLTTRQCAWVGSLLELGRIFGPLVSALMLDNFGRKLSLRYCTMILLIAFLLAAFYKTVWALYLFRLFLGIATGSNDSSSSIYLAEICSANLRSIFCSIIILAYFCGILFDSIVATYLSYDSVVVINASICFVGLLSSVLLIESPYFLLMKSNLKKARRNYLWIKGSNKWENVSVEFDQICQHLEEQKNKKHSYRELFTDKANRRSITVVLILSTLTLTTGFPSIISFNSMIFISNDVFSNNEFCVLTGLVLIVSSCVFTFIIERFNRKTLLSFSLVVIGFSHLVSSTLYFVQEKVTPFDGFSWLIFASVLSYMVLFTLMYSIIHIMRGELFPQSIKAYGSSLSIMTESLTGFLITNVFLDVSESFGMYVNFLFYFVISVIAFLFVCFKLPETRGRTLVEIQNSITL